MAKHVIKGYITYEQSPYRKEPEISWQDHVPSKEYFPEKVIVAEHSIEVEVPDGFDPRGLLVASLQEQKQKVRAEFTRRIKEIDTQINNLLAIENKPTVDA